MELKRRNEAVPRGPLARLFLLPILFLAINFSVTEVTNFPLWEGAAVFGLIFVIKITEYLGLQTENHLASVKAALAPSTMLASARRPMGGEPEQTSFIAPAKEEVMKSAKTARPRTEPAKLLRPSDPEAVKWEMQQIQLAITRRAYELFEARNREHGHDWEDWFQSESELLRPVSIAISEAADRLSVRANVLGLSETELKVSVEPKRLVILGAKQMMPADATRQTQPADFYPDQVLKVVELPAEIDPDGSVIELQAGVLKFELPKIAKSGAKAVGV